MEAREAQLDGTLCRQRGSELEGSSCVLCDALLPSIAAAPVDPIRAIAQFVAETDHLRSLTEKIDDYELEGLLPGGLFDACRTHILAEGRSNVHRLRSALGLA